MNSSHAHSAFYRNFMNITLFMAQPIDFPRLEANRPSQWDDSSQGQANRPSGEANHLSSAPSTIYPFLWPLVVMYPFSFMYSCPFWAKLGCGVPKPLIFFLLFIPFLYNIFWFIFGIWYCFKYVFGIFVWFCFIPLCAIHVALLTCYAYTLAIIINMWIFNVKLFFTLYVFK